MGTKTLIRLVIALAVLGGIAAILHFAGSGGAVSEVSCSTTKKKVFDDFPINDIAKVVIKQKDGSITLNKLRALCGRLAPASAGASEICCRSSACTTVGGR